MSVPTLVLLHGAGQSARYFEALLPALERVLSGRAAVVGLSMPGRAEARGAPLASAHAMASWCEALCASRGFERLVVLGHSLGGAVAIEMALRQRERAPASADLAEAASALTTAPSPPRIDALVLVSTGARLRVQPSILEAAETAAERGEPNPFGDPAVPAETALADWLAADAFDRLRDLSSIDLSVLVAVGATDPLTPPRYAQFLADHIPGASLRNFDQAGHDLPCEAPDLLAAWVAHSLRW